MTYLFVSTLTSAWSSRTGALAILGQRQLWAASVNRSKRGLRIFARAQTFRPNCRKAVIQSPVEVNLSAMAALSQLLPILRFTRTSAVSGQAKPFAISMVISQGIVAPSFGQLQASMSRLTNTTLLVATEQSVRLLQYAVKPLRSLPTPLQLLQHFELLSQPCSRHFQSSPALLEPIRLWPAQPRF